MKIFLLGAFGFIGQHLAKKLIQLGHEYITEMRYWRDRYDCIINLAAVTHINTEFDPQIFESNVVLANEVFKRPERIIYASSCSAKYLTNPYAYTKRYNEWLGEKHGDALGLRFHNVYGPENNKGIVWWLMQQKDGARINVRGDQLIRDYIHVENVVDIVSLCISQLPAHNIRDIGLPEKAMNPKYFDKGVVDVGTGIGTQTMDLVNLYMKLSGKSFIIDVSEPGDNEPASMISENIVPHMSLEEGLRKTIEQ